MAISSQEPKRVRWPPTKVYVAGGVVRAVVVELNLVFADMECQALFEGDVRERAIPAGRLP
jgi:hypothetical protein